MNLLTRRLPTILGLLLLFGVAGGLWWWIQNSRPVISEATRPQKVRVTNIADNKLSVSWITDELSVGQIEYGKVGEKLTSLTNDDRGQATDKHVVHHITITDLQPNTQYAFRIISGDKGAKFDNNGSPYSVTTGKVISGTPSANSLYGSVELSGSDGAIVYVAIPGGEPASTIITSSGNYSVPIATIRSTAGNGYMTYESETTSASVSVEDGSKSSQATISMGDISPVPTITMGETYDFRANVAVEPEIAQVESGITPEPVTIFNVEPLSDGEMSDEREITILNPSTDGEELATTLPEFRGLAPAGVTLSITLHASVVYSDTIVVGNDETWEWTPPEELINGQHDISVSYVDEGRIEQKVERSFFISTALADSGDPSYEATPSGGIYASPTPATSPVASDVGRITIPSTESGVPVSGVLDHTILTGGLGIVIMVLGAMMLAL